MPRLSASTLELPHLLPPLHHHHLQPERLSTLLRSLPRSLHPMRTARWNIQRLTALYQTASLPWTRTSLLQCLTVRLALQVHSFILATSTAISY